MRNKFFFRFISLALLAGIFVFSSAWGAKRKGNNPVNSLEEPDFAFPETVYKNAGEVLNGKRSPEEKFKAALQIVLARNIISADSIMSAASLLDSMANISAEPYRQLYLLSEAMLYSDYYSRSSWKFNSRNLPGEPEGNPAEWSKRQFAAKVCSLLSRVTAQEESLRIFPLRNFSGLLDKDFNDYEYFPSLYDFLAVRSLAILRPFVNQETEIPFYRNEGKKEADLSAEALCQYLTGSEKKYFKPGSAPWSYWAVNDFKGEIEERNNIILEQYSLAPDSVFSGNLLCDLYTEAMDTARKSQVYRLIETELKKFPDARFAPNLKQMKEKMSFPSVSVSVEGQFLSRKDISGKATVRNINAPWLLLLKVPDNISDEDLRADTDAKKSMLLRRIRGFRVMATKLLRNEGEVPFVYNSDFSFPAQPYGRYLVVASESPGTEGIRPSQIENARLKSVRVSDLRIIESEESTVKDSRKLWLVSGENQKPVGNASVKVYERDGKGIKQLRQTLLTDSRGLIPAEGNRIILDITSGKDQLTYDTYTYYHSPYRPDSISAAIFTDLSIYHPGDSVGFAVILFDTSRRCVVADKNLEVRMTDPNGKERAKVSLKTDEDGRAWGNFAIPDAGLLGDFILEGKIGEKFLTSTYFTVADYKAPGFFVELEKEDGNSPDADALNFKGLAKTYSGMPLADAEVDYKLSARSGWWMRGESGGNGYFGGTVTTDSRGEFHISLPLKNVRNTAFSRSLFILSADVTSPAGETVSSEPLHFSLSSAYRIEASVPEKIQVSASGNVIGVRVLDILSESVRSKVSYEIRGAEGDSVTVASGSFDTPELKINLSSIPSGRYIFRFTLPQDSSVYETYSTILFRIDDKKTPVRTPIWLPQEEIVYKDKAESVRVKVGSSLKDGWILSQVQYADGKTDWNWIQLQDEVKEIIIPVGGGVRHIWFTGTSDLTTEIGRVNLLPESSLIKMETEVVTFRDHILPGTPETWEFKYKVGGKPAAYVPVLAVMSDYALDALVPFNWMFKPEYLFPGLPSPSISYSRSGFVNSEFNWRGRRSFPVVSLYSQPLLNLYGYPTLFPGYGYTRSLTKYKIRGSSIASDDSENVMTAVEAEQAPLYAKVASANAMTYSASGRIMEEEASDEMKTETTESNSPLPLRSGTYPLAFFRPGLTADKDGFLTLKFTAPDHNTRWKLQMLGYDRNLNHSLITKFAEASRPVMVRPELPRFARTGDKIRFGVTAYNNSGKVLPLTCRTEIFSPATGEILHSFSETKESVASEGSFTSFAEFTAPDDSEILGIRVFAQGDGFSDGEQKLLSILPASSPVFSSTEIYSAAGDTDIMVKLPDYGSQGIVSLQYCDNPVWTCVSALPGLVETESDNILSIVNAFYANRTGKGICSKFPAVRAALEEWSADPPKSSLYGNESLRTFALENTTWVRNAEAEQARMDRLYYLLDNDRIDKADAALLESMKRLQNSDGGWSWCPGMQSSRYISMCVLDGLGMIADSGFLGDEPALWEMIKRGVKYCDSEFVSDYKKYKKLPSGVEDWLCVRSSFNIGMDAAFRQIYLKGLEKIRSGWKAAEINRAASYAVLLWKEGKKEDARMILESLVQKSVCNPEKGMYYDNLDSRFGSYGPTMDVAKVLKAFSIIEPESEYVDQLRQWLLLRKQTLDWGGGRYAAEAVNAILASGAGWTGKTSQAEIRLGDESLEIPFRERLTGAFTIDLDPAKASGALLSIKRDAGCPAWGGVVAQSIQPVKEVKAESSASLSVKKNLYVVVADENGTSLSERTPSVGDRVRVILTLTADRDIDYVSVKDERAACMEPVEQIPAFTGQEGVWYYREPRNSVTDFFISYLPKGVHIISYDCFITQAGSYSFGIATAQSQYAPVIVAHSGGEELTVGN